MKILLVIDQFDNGNNGTTISARRFAEGLMQRGHTVYVASTGDQKENKYVMKELPMGPIVSHIVKAQGMTFAIPNKKLLEEAISKVDVVHFYMPFGLSVKGLEIAEKLKVPHTAAFHVQPENITYTLKLGNNAKINDKIYSFYRDKFYNHFTHIHCPSHFIAGELEKRGYTAKLHVISNGIDSEFSYQPMEKQEQWKDKIVITMIGRLSNEKRQDLIIEAIAKSKYESRIQLVLAGKGLNYNKYKKMGEKLTNPPIMQFYEKQELIALLNQTDIYVHSSDAEIEAISCIEAIACGNVPIIANSSRSATPQFALDDRSLFEAGNSDSLKEKIEYWIEEEAERKRMKLLYAQSADKYRIEKSMQEIERMFIDAREGR